MEIVTINIGKKAQVVIPKRARDTIGITQGGAATLIYEKGQGILLGNPTTYGKLLRGLGKEIWKKAGGGSKYLEKERDSWDKT